MTRKDEEKPRGAHPNHRWEANFGDARLDTPTFHRNHDPILAVVKKHLFQKRTGAALEIGSGSGQHVMGFAGAFPNLTWYPSDPEPSHRASTNAWRNAHNLTNVADARNIDVSTADWGISSITPLQAMICINVLHIAPWSVTEGLICGAGEHLASGACLFIYGPFKRAGIHTAESNATFDRSLRARNPAWGIRNTDDIVNLAESYGLGLTETAAMPANNFTLVFSHKS